MSILKEKLQAVFYEAENRLKKYPNEVFKSIFVKIKYADFKSTTIESQLSFNFLNIERLFEKRMLEKKEKVRLLGVGVRFFHQDGTEQLCLPFS